jgi:hypothetical protein
VATPAADAGTTGDAIFVPDGDHYVPTALGASPWGPDSLHGGAPAALLARALEAGAGPGMQLVRMTVEILRPVPLAPLHIETTELRPGRRVQLVESRLYAGDVEVTRATGLRLHRTDLPLPDVAVDDEPPPPPPDTGRPTSVAWEWTAFHSHGVEIRTVDGDFMTPGPSTAWFRLRHPIVAGETPSPVMRVAAAADFGNGISQLLPMEQWVFVNPDLSITLSRPPVGEWVCLAATTHLAGAGAGFAESALYDERGRIGRATQSLLLDRR